MYDTKLYQLERTRDNIQFKMSILICKYAPNKLLILQLKQAAPKHMLQINVTNWQSYLLSSKGDITETPDSNNYDKAIY